MQRHPRPRGLVWIRRQAPRDMLAQPHALGQRSYLTPHCPWPPASTPVGSHLSISNQHNYLIWAFLTSFHSKTSRQIYQRTAHHRKVPHPTLQRTRTRHQLIIPSKGMVSVAAYLFLRLFSLISAYLDILRLPTMLLRRTTICGKMIMRIPLSGLVAGVA